jgi:hypothetical protein
MPNDLIYAGLKIRARGDQLCLTDMWRAAGADDSKRPVDWARLPATIEFVEYIAENLKVGKSHLFQIERGRDGGTWAHWQVGIAYAKYLSPEFQAWCNEVVRAHMERRHPSALSTQIELKMLEALERRVDHHDVRLDQHEQVLVDMHKLAYETHGNVLAVRQWQEKTRLPKPRRFSDEDERVLYLVVHLEFGGKCPIDRVTHLTDDNGKRLPDVSEVDHWHGPQYNRIENGLPVSLAVHKKLTADQQFRNANAGTFQHFHLVREKLKEQGFFIKPKQPSKSRKKGPDKVPGQGQLL